jgi:hypothetical protein
MAKNILWVCLHAMSVAFRLVISDDFVAAADLDATDFWYGSLFCRHSTLAISRGLPE